MAGCKGAELNDLVFHCRRGDLRRRNAVRRGVGFDREKVKKQKTSKDGNTIMGFERRAPWVCPQCRGTMYIFERGGKEYFSCCSCGYEISAKENRRLIRQGRLDDSAIKAIEFILSRNNCYAKVEKTHDGICVKECLEDIRYKTAPEVEDVSNKEESKKNEGAT